MANKAISLEQMSRIWGKVKTYVANAISGLYTKPSSGIPKSDLSSDVQTSLGKADTAIQSHQDISGKQDVISDLATIRSGAALGATALQSHQDISGKQDVISDLATIRSGAQAGSTALQPNDIADWAKQPTRPSYTANDTGALPNTTTLADLEDATHKTVTPTEKATWNAKQDALVSGTNIKTINNESVVGSGNINISGGDGPYYGTIDSSSTATALTATVEGLTELKAGTMVYIRNAVRDGNSSCTLNVNNLGALPIYRSDLANSRTGFNTNTSWIFVYNPSRVEGGCWDQQWGKYEYVNLGYYDRESEYSPIAKEGANRSCIAFTYSETEILPICNNYVFTTLDFDPFGQIYHLNANNTIAGNSVTGSNLYLRNVVDLRNIIQSAANYLTPNKKVYLQCEPLVDGNGNRTGRVRISTATACPLVQELPTTADGYVYIYLGALGAQYYQFRLQAVHPVYEYRNNGIKLWIGD